MTPMADMPCSRASISLPLIRPPPASSASSEPSSTGARMGRGPPRSPSCSAVSFARSALNSLHSGLAASLALMSALNVSCASSHAACISLHSSSTKPISALRTPLGTARPAVPAAASSSGSGLHSLSPAPGPTSFRSAAQPSTNSGVASSSVLLLKQLRTMRSTRACSAEQFGCCHARCTSMGTRSVAEIIPSIKLLPAPSRDATASATHTRWLPTADCAWLLYCTVTCRGVSNRISCSTDKHWRHSPRCGLLPSMTSLFADWIMPISRCSSTQSCCNDWDSCGMADCSIFCSSSMSHSSSGLTPASVS
mmetsp:Transcript_22255/g.48617  ORF Transcript_22255/g.48617 Transcript_22255/m.48617 type:complete len:309 (-) Transcript_22255:582-1508(-)